MLDIWKEILVIITGSPVLLALIQYFKKRSKERELNKWKEGFDQLTELYQTLASILATTDCCRVILSYTTNGGGVPKLGCIIRSSIEEEVYADNLYPIKKKWQSIEMDAEFNKIMYQLIKKKHVKIKSDDLKPRSILYDWCISGQVKRSELFYVCQTTDRLYYLSLNYTIAAKADREDLSTQDESTIRIGAAKIKSMMTIFHKVLD